MNNTQDSKQPTPPALAPVTGSASGFWRSPRGENHGLNSKPGDVWVNPGDIHDTDRLNWLEQTQTSIGYNVECCAWGVDYEAPYGQTIREAIDAAMMQNSVLGDKSAKTGSVNEMDKGT